MAREQELHLLFVGDVVGKPGRNVLAHWLPRLRAEFDLDLVVVNGENAAGGLGLTAEKAQWFIAQGCDVITCGNHVWKYKDLIPILKEDSRFVRPANYPRRAPGRGATVVRDRRGRPVAVLHLAGRVFMEQADCPFAMAEELLPGLAAQTRAILVDFHAEATSEKIALARFLDGRVTLLAGTHTHVQTADEELLPGGTAYITDVGMTGPHDGVIGVKTELILEKFLTSRPQPFTPATGQMLLSAVYVRADYGTGRALEIVRLSRGMRDSE